MDIEINQHLFAFDALRLMRHKLSEFNHIYTLPWSTRFYGNYQSILVVLILGSGKCHLDDIGDLYLRITIGIIEMDKLFDQELERSYQDHP